MKLNEKIYWCRKRAGLSQESLAERIGVSRQSISKWETGEASPEISKLPLLASAFGVTADWLLSEEGVPEEEPATDQAPEASVAPQPVSAPAWPGWVESLPGFIGRAIKQFGWLHGVRMAIGNALFAAFGLLMRAVGSSFDNSLSDPFSASGSVTWYDEFGQVVDPPLHAEDIYSSLGMDGAGSAFVASGADPLAMISGFVIFIGVAGMIAGIVLAVALRRWGRAEG